jgi:hypothetical protein
MASAKVVRRRFVYATEEDGDNVILGVTIWEGPEGDPPAARQIGPTANVVIPRDDFERMTDAEVQGKVEAVCEKIEQAAERQETSPEAVSARINERLNG